MFWFILTNSVLGLVAVAALTGQQKRMSTAASHHQAVADARCVAASTTRARRAARIVVALWWHARERPAMLAIARDLEAGDTAAMVTAVDVADARTAELVRPKSVEPDVAVGLIGEALQQFGVRLEAPATVDQGRP